MKTIFFIFLSIVLINSVFSSECTNKKAIGQPETPSQIEETGPTSKPIADPTSKPTSKGAEEGEGEGAGDGEGEGAGAGEGEGAGAGEGEGEGSGAGEGESAGEGEGAEEGKGAGEGAGEGEGEGEGAGGGAGEGVGEGDRRRLNDLLDEDDCKKLKTQDDNRYQCVASSDRKSCQEVEKEGSKILYLSFYFILIFIIL